MSLVANAVTVLDLNEECEFAVVALCQISSVHLELDMGDKSLMKGEFGTRNAGSPVEERPGILGQPVIKRDSFKGWIKRAGRLRSVRPSSGEKR